jgi:hypothetical protein
MRADQGKINVLTAKMRDMKRKLKNNVAETPSAPSSPLRDIGRATSPARMMLHDTDLLDPSAFRYDYM